MKSLSFIESIMEGVPKNIPLKKGIDALINHAPKRKDILSKDEKIIALKNALRYFPSAQHEELAVDFLAELKEFGRIYMHRFRPDY